MSTNGITPELLQLLAGMNQGPDQPAQQMSQQGQFNPANVQAGPQPFSFAPIPGGIGINLLNALANAGKAATYVAESPREREMDDARAQQLYETKQKMALAAGEFGQREQDRQSAAAQQKAQFGQKEADRSTQLKIAQMGKDTEAARLKEEQRHNLATEGKPTKPDSAEQQFIDWYLQSHPDKNVGDAVTAYAKAHDKPGTESGTWQLSEDSKGNPVLFNSKTGQTKAAPDVRKPGTYAKGQGAADDAFNYASDYMGSNKFTGPGDEALMEKFFELAKPSSGFRMTQAQIEMLQRSRDLMGGLAARAKHALTPEAPWFSDTQRQQIVDTMTRLKEAKGKQGAGTPPQQSQPQSSNGRRVIDLTQ